MRRAEQLVVIKQTEPRRLILSYKNPCESSLLDSPATLDKYECEIRSFTPPRYWEHERAQLTVSARRRNRRNPLAFRVLFARVVIFIWALNLPGQRPDSYQPRANALGSSPPRCGPQANGLLHRAPLEPSTDLACEMMTRAFSARAQLGCDDPKALPWADMNQAFGLEDTEASNSK